MWDKKKTLIIYDGSCGLCHFCVRFIIERDTHRSFLFTALQGKTAQQLILPQVDTLIVLDKGQIFIKGQAALRLLIKLYPHLFFLRYLPSFLLDFFYDYVAKRRQQFFQQPACFTPDQLDPSQFLP